MLEGNFPQALPVRPGNSSLATVCTTYILFLSGFEVFGSVANKTSETKYITCVNTLGLKKENDVLLLEYGRPKRKKIQFGTGRFEDYCPEPLVQLLAKIIRNSPKYT